MEECHVGTRPTTKKKTKYGTSQLKDTDSATGIEQAVAEATRESIREILNEWNLKLD
jgi:predicted GTPase